MAKIEQVFMGSMSREEWNAYVDRGVELGDEPGWFEKIDNKGNWYREHGDRHCHWADCPTCPTPVLRSWYVESQ